MVIGIYGKLCEVETGQNNIIVDIEESRGNGKFMPVYFSIQSNRGHNFILNIWGEFIAEICCNWN